MEWSALGSRLCIGITFANLKGLGKSDLATFRLKICVNTDEIIGAASFKNVGLILLQRNTQRLLQHYIGKFRSFRYN